VLLLTATIVAAAAIVVGARLIAVEIRQSHRDAANVRTLTILQTLAPGIEAARSDPRALLVWHPIAQTLRRLCPDEFAVLDGAAGGPFPFPPDQLRAAHAQWTADWLAWERSHDADYKDRAAVAQQELEASRDSAAAHAKVDAVERQKLELYQRRYQEYIQVGKALQSLIGG